MALRQKQEKFCTEYLKDLNATQAAIRAGYSEKTAGIIGFENLTKPKIQERVQKLINDRAKEVKIDAAYVLNRMVEIDQLDVLDIIKDDLSGFRLLSEWPKSWRISISSIDMKKMVDGSDIETIVEKIKWPDKTKNLELIGRHISVKAFEKETQVINNNNIMPIPTADSIDDWQETASKQQDDILGR